MFAAAHSLLNVASWNLERWLHKEAGGISQEMKVIVWKSYAGSYYIFFFFFAFFEDNYADCMSINVPFINFRAHTSPAAFLSALPIMFASVSQEYY